MRAKIDTIVVTISKVENKFHEIQSKNELLECTHGQTSTR
jgi:hypothetical protein